MPRSRSALRRAGGDLDTDDGLQRLLLRSPWAPPALRPLERRRGERGTLALAGALCDALAGAFRERPREHLADCLPDGFRDGFWEASRDGFREASRDALPPRLRLREGPLPWLPAASSRLPCRLRPRPRLGSRCRLPRRLLLDLLAATAGPSRRALRDLLRLRLRTAGWNLAARAPAWLGNLAARAATCGIASGAPERTGGAWPARFWPGMPRANWIITHFPCT